MNQYEDGDIKIDIINFIEWEKIDELNFSNYTWFIKFNNKNWRISRYMRKQKKK